MVASHPALACPFLFPLKQFQLQEIYTGINFLRICFKRREVLDFPFIGVRMEVEG
jgi:hypothetical protein